MYILDEPTTGLHIADVHKLVDILQRLVDTGNSIIVIEHNLDLIKTADYIIEDQKEETKEVKLYLLVLLSKLQEMNIVIQENF